MTSGLQESNGALPGILVALGTRPEAIKLVPVIRALRAAAIGRVVVVATAQHRDMVDPILAFFGIHVDHDLDIMTEGQGPADVTARVLTAITEVYERERPDLVMVQGDTSSAAAAALAAFYRKIPVAHVEAGLRTGDRFHPFPEEMNRRLLTQIAELHFPPTDANRENLLREGVPAEAIVVTGNTVIDTLNEIVGGASADAKSSGSGRRMLLLTTHRRENFGEPQRNVFEAINRLLERNEDVEVLFPVHPNPAVLDAVREHLKPHPRLHTTGPLSYPEFIAAMARAFAVISDSGGVQEEAPALGIPVIILRTTTERQEALMSGNAMLAELVSDRIVDTVERLLTDGALHASMSRPAFPFGGAGASARIVEAVRTWLARRGDSR